MLDTQLVALIQGRNLCILTKVSELGGVHSYIHANIA